MLQQLFSPSVQHTLDLVGIFVFAISGALLEMHGFLGKPGWFWMFFIEGIPAVIMGIFAWFWLALNRRGFLPEPTCRHR